MSEQTTNLLRALTREQLETEAVEQGKQLTALNREIVRLRRGWLTTIQAENSCTATGQPCAAKRCGCAAEMDMLMRENAVNAG